jgi:threonine dehydrogenase-like Zn-dependent dehydrogenase
MKAAQLIAAKQVAIVERPQPTPGPSQVLVRVLGCGVCGSDLNAWRGVSGVQLPLAAGAPGHEVWGEVAEAGPAVGRGAPAVGRKVTGLVQGGYAEYALAEADALLDVPAYFGDRILLGEPLACAANVVRRSGWRAGQRVAVVGFGYLAALVIQLLLPRGQGEWVAVSRRPESRALALELGATAAHGFEAVPPELWDSFPIVIEAAGVQHALDYATWLTAYGGRLVIAGYHADGPRTVNLQSWNWKGIDVVNAHERRPEVYLQGLRDGLRRVEQLGLDLSALISHRWPLEHLADALAAADARPPGYLKGVVLPWNR